MPSCLATAFPKRGPIEAAVDPNSRIPAVASNSEQLGTAQQSESPRIGRLQSRVHRFGVSMARSFNEPARGRWSVEARPRAADRSGLAFVAHRGHLRVRAGAIV